VVTEQERTNNMATCRECLHNAVCKYSENRSNGGYCTRKKCLNFKPKSDYVKRERGEWISLEPEIGLFKCSLCDHIIVHGECNFCPNCGSDMRKEDNNG
jgi:hypothetical protein